MELWQMSARDLATAFAQGEVSSTEIITAHLARIDEVNSGLNAIVTRMDDQALAAAREADEARARGEALGPLAGVPFTIKSNIDVAGMATDCGVPAFKESIAPKDAPVVERMKQAGGVPLARTNLPDLGLRLHTDCLLHGQTINPWSKDHTTGGSSGGEAVALATGMSPIGLGNDLGGSLRSPASCCSIASIKPTTGRVPRVGDIPPDSNAVMMQQFAAEGPMARNVGDVRLGLQVLSGEHPRDPLSMPIPLEGREGQKRVAIMAAPPGGETDPRVAEVVTNAAKALESAGVIVEEVDMPEYTQTLDCWIDYVVGDITVGFDAMESMISESSADFLRNTIEAYGPINADRRIAALQNRYNLQRAWIDFYADWDALLTPTWTQLPLLAGQDAMGGPDGARYMIETFRPVCPGNVLGLPSAAVPAGMVDGLPVGVLLTGRQWSELTCLELAEHIESAGLAPQMPMDPKP
ncbi:MAG: indole acetimide hydrolase [Alphaproteobacteria bacterium]|nr:MAG: indole acetimide hydrolase [Alphaproteobacteria bacterium]